MRAMAAILWAAVLCAPLCTPLCIAGCGGGSGETGDDGAGTDVATSGDEGMGDTETEAVAEETAPPPRSGPGRLHVVNRVGGADVGGTVRVTNDAGETVAEGASGDTFDVPSGDYSVEGTITDAALLIDRPTRPLDGGATVVPGETADAQINFPVSRIRVEVRRRGTVVRTWRLTVHPQGAEEPEIVIEPSRDHVPITPGRYEGSLRAGSSEIAVNGLIFQGGATMSVPINME